MIDFITHAFIITSFIVSGVLAFVVIGAVVVLGVGTAIEVLRGEHDAID